MKSCFETLAVLTFSHTVSGYFGAKLLIELLLRCFLHLMFTGVEGVLQAMLLSIGSFKFGNHHLEMDLEPKDTHRDLIFHRINYGNNTHLNVSLLVGDDNRANIYVSLDRNDKPYYACDAGCLDPPRQLRLVTVNFIFIMITIQLVQIILIGTQSKLTCPTW